MQQIYDGLNDGHGAAKVVRVDKVLIAIVLGGHGCPSQALGAAEEGFNA